MTSTFPFKIKINSIDLGITEDPDPAKDVHKYLYINDFVALPRTDKEELTIQIYPKEFHIESSPIRYCDKCLESGKRTTEIRSVSKAGHLCYDHLLEKMKKEKPEEVCPKCKNGYMSFGTCDNYCSNPKCDYQTPHEHRPGPYTCTCGPTLN